jgi:hypothetical protein
LRVWRLVALSAVVVSRNRNIGAYPKIEFRRGFGRYVCGK